MRYTIPSTYSLILRIANDLSLISPEHPSRTTRIQFVNSTLLSSCIQIQTNDKRPGHMAIRMIYLTIRHSIPAGKYPSEESGNKGINAPSAAPLID